MNRRERSILIGIFLVFSAITIGYIVASAFDGADVVLLASIEDMALYYGYAGLFFISLLGGSIVPAGSPFIVISFAALGFNKAAIILVASAGFTAGIVLNYYLAKLLGHNYVERHISSKNYADLMRWWGRWDIWLLVAFSFIPILPTSALALVCRLFRVNIFHVAIINFAGSVFNAALLVYAGVALESLFI